MYGGGLLGLYACSLFLEQGFQVLLSLCPSVPAPRHQVFLSDPMGSRREQAALFGALGVQGEEVAERQYDVVLEVGRGEGGRSNVQVCGVGAVVRQGLEVLRPGGVIVLVGCVTPDTGHSAGGKN